ANLHTIDLSDNAFGPAGADPLCRLIIENRNIKTLRLNNNGLGTEGARLLSKAFVAAAVAHERSLAEDPESVDPDTAKLTTLHSLFLARNRLESGGGSLFAVACERLSELRELRMPQNSIRVEGIQNILRATGKCCPKLERLDLEDNTFQLEGSKALVAALPSWPNLRVLNIGDCLLGKDGCRMILGALTGSHVELESLWLTYNEMDLAGAKLIPTMMTGKTKLTSLYLNGNAFDPDAEVVTTIRDKFRSLGHVDGLDELDEMDVESDNGDDEKEEDEDTEDDEAAGGKVAPPPKKQGGALNSKKDEVDGDIDSLAEEMGKNLSI
ncbi:hypothetical protein HK405_015394, partial [Cladochytrium tenue]